MPARRTGIFRPRCARSSNASGRTGSVRRSATCGTPPPMEPTGTMRGIEPPRVRDGRFEIVIETEGLLPLPPELVRSLGLAPGDIVVLKPVDETVRIQF